MNNSIFVTATDTEVGKTFISSILIAYLLKKGKNPAYIKPVETGLGESLNPIDYNFVKHVNPSLKINNEKSVPLRLVYPLSPLDSAKKQGIKIDKTDMVNKVKSVVSEYQYNVIEGAGGIYVPITKDYNILDLIKELDIPVLVVARSGLGTINHSCLTINKLKSYGIKVNAFILNGNMHENVYRNVANIERMTGVNCAGIVPYIENINEKEISALKIDFQSIFTP